MTRQVYLKVIGPNGKELFGRSISSSVEDIPYSTLIDAMDCIFASIPHSTHFIIDTIDSIK